MTMAPVAEVGQGEGRRYYEPVKVAALADGSVRVTEQDGDQFSVSPTGVIGALTKGLRWARPMAAHQVKIYDDDPATRTPIDGRGYVQLTWWSNYATAGVALSRWARPVAESRTCEGAGDRLCRDVARNADRLRFRQRA